MNAACQICLRPAPHVRRNHVGNITYARCSEHHQQARLRNRASSQRLAQRLDEMGEGTTVHRKEDETDDELKERIREDQS